MYKFERFFSHCLGCLFSRMIVFFIISSFMRCHLLIVVLYTFNIGILFRKFFPKISFSVYLSYIGKLLIFYVLILYSDILLKVFINFISFLMVMLGYYKYRNISHTNSDCWTFSFPICVTFILLDKMLVTILNRIEDYKHPCLVPAFNENVL